MANAVLEDMRKRLKEAGGGLSALKKEVDGVINPKIQQLLSERASLEGQMKQLLDQAGVSSVEELEKKTQEKIEEFMKEYEVCNTVVSNVRGILSDVDKRKEEIARESDIANTK